MMVGVSSLEVDNGGDIKVLNLSIRVRHVLLKQFGHSGGLFPHYLRGSAVEASPSPNPL